MNPNNDLKYRSDIEEDEKKKKQKEMSESNNEESKLEIFME